MRSASLRYFVVLLLVSFVVVWFFRHMSATISAMIPGHLAGHFAPVQTQVAIILWWWPTVFVAIAFVGIIASLLFPDRSRILCHMAFVLLAVELLALIIMTATLCTILSTVNWQMAR